MKVSTEARPRRSKASRADRGRAPKLATGVSPSRRCVVSACYSLSLFLACIALFLLADMLLHNPPEGKVEAMVPLLFCIGFSGMWFAIGRYLI